MTTVVGKHASTIQAQQNLWDAQAKLKAAQKAAEEAEELDPFLNSVIDQTIMNMTYDNYGEGKYTLLLSNGKLLTFTSSGDDMTHTSVSLEDVK